jgi:HlyD family secretion protein
MAAPTLILSLMAMAGCGGREHRLVEGSGVIEVTEVVVRSQAVGRVVSSKFEEGRPVEAGQVLALLASDELSARERQALSAAAAARQQTSLAETNLRLAEDNYARNRVLRDSGMISEQSFYHIESQLKAARSQREAARGAQAQALAGLDLARVQSSNATITSPVSGTVLERNIEVGELAMAGTAICKLGDLSRPFLRIYLPENRYGRVKLGQAAVIRVDSYPGRVFPGRVAAIADQAEFTPKDVQTKEERTKLVFAVKIAMENPDGELKPGMPADAEITAE